MWNLVIGLFTLRTDSECVFFFFFLQFVPVYALRRISDIWYESRIKSKLSVEAPFCKQIETKKFINLLLSLYDAFVIEGNRVPCGAVVLTTVVVLCNSLVEAAVVLLTVVCCIVCTVVPRVVTALVSLVVVAVEQCVIKCL